MIRRLFRLRSFRAPFTIGETQYEIEVVPQAMLVNILYLDKYPLPVPFHVDDVKKEVLPIPPVRFPSLLEDDEADPDKVTLDLAKLMAAHLFCPHCGQCADEKDGFDSNSLPSTSYNHTLLCLGCKHQWDPNS